MKYNDLREWIEIVRNWGELTTIPGAHWDLEIGALTDLGGKMGRGPALLFDSIPGYPEGFRVLTNALASGNRLALTLGLPGGLSDLELMRAWQRRSQEIRLIPPKKVGDGPVMENVMTGDDIDVFKFPAPRWHELDGGRYIGTGSAVISLDPDEGWVNLGTYRMMTQDRNHISLYISPGKHGRIHREKYLSRNRPWPVAVSFGHDPLIFLVSSLEVLYGVSEYEYAGGIKGEPIEVIEGRVTGLPFPASSELVMEGFIYPGDVRPEGPFGEWTGYYASAQREEPVLEVKAIYHRNDPIILGSPPGKPPVEQSYYRAIMRAALIDEELRRAGVPDVRGVWCHQAGGSRLLTVVAIRQRYPGHAKQAALIASACHAGAYLGRYVIVVDDDIDITNLEEVMWAVCTRSDPEKDIDIIRRCWSGPLDPIIPPGQKGFNSRGIIDATRPYEWRDEFPPVVEVSPELKERVLKKWGDLLKKGGER